MSTKGRFAITATLLIGLLIILVVSVTALAQGGTGKITPPPPPKKTTTTTPKKTPAKKTSSGNSKTPPTGNQTSNAANELVFWNSIKDSTDPEDFKEYLEKYPSGQFVGLARRRVAALTNAGAPKPTPGTSTTNTATSPAKPKAGTVVRNQSGMELVLIPPGSFTMGSTNGDADEKPAHQVTINYSFYVGKYEVTQAQWQAVMGNNPSSFKDCGGNCPVETVSWDDAQNFINKLNEANDGFKYRLPTEAEWEYACRAGTTGAYYAADVDDIGWYGDNSGKKTHSVGGKQPNAFGLYDMSGNVWEWCRDWYHDNYNGAPSDGTAWLDGGGQQYRVLRGGSWSDDATGLRSALRGGHTPDDRYGNLGFRIVAIARTQ